MEAKQFYNRSISPIVIKTFACKWSEDNRLSIVTEKGVHVFEISPAPMQANPIIKLPRTFIHSPEALPGDFYTNDVLSEIFNWKKEDIYAFLMKEAYTPTFPKATKVIPEIVDVFWSPSKLLHPQNCLIAMITSTGAVEIAAQIDRNWISIYDFTAVWIEIIHKELIEVKGDKKLDCTALKNQLNRLLATTATWSCIYCEPNDKCFAYLVTAYRNSEIVVWKVYKVMDNINTDTVANVEFKFKIKVIDEDVKINSLLWVHLNEKNYLLFIGFFNGQIGTLKLQENNGEIISSSYSTFYPDIDRIPIDFIRVLHQTNERIEIIVVKGMYLLLFTLDINGNMIDTKFVSSPGFSITGASIVNPNMILITTQEGNIFTIQKDEDKKDLVCTVLKSDISKKHVQYLGLTNSPNNQLFTLITSPSVMYDHLIEREPSSVYFFNLHNVSSLDPLNIMYSNKEQSLLKCWDCLELIKIDALKHSNISKILFRTNLDLESLSLHKLRIAFWIMTIHETVKKKNSPETVVKHAEELDQCKNYIFLYSASNHLRHLALQKHLSEEQKLSMSLLRNHLDIWLAGEEEEAETPLSRSVKEVLEITSKFDLITQEKCSFCNVIITEPWASSCSSGHKLPRCALTCLQVTCTNYRTCNVCQEIFHPCLDVEMCEVRCLYCDLPVFYKNQLTDALETCKKNLSKRQIAAGNNKDAKEDEL